MRHAAFLRGINVGKAKRVSMSDLKRVMEGLGYTNVKTLFNSGNIVFDISPRSSRTTARGSGRRSPRSWASTPV